MEIGVQEIASLLITGLFGALFLLFIVQSVLRHRSARTLVISLLFGILAGIFAVFSSGEVVPISGFYRDVFLSLQLNLYGFQFFFFFVFLEQLIRKNLHPGYLTVVLSLLVLQTLSLWFIVSFNSYSEVTSILWFFADLGYSSLAIFVYLVRGVPIYLKTYKYTREVKPLIFSISLLIISAGFIIGACNDYFGFFGLDWFSDIASVGIILPMLGLLIFTVLYLVNIDYLYRLPNDIFLLMVLTKPGIPLFSVKLRTRKRVKIEEDLLSGLISAVNNVFEEIFKTKSAIQNISGKEISLLMESAGKIVVLVITDKISHFLDLALKRYTKEFEVRFRNLLEEKIQDTVKYKDAIELLTPIFPFFIIEKDS